MFNSLIKKLGWLFLASVAFLGLANWVGVADKTATPSSIAQENEKQIPTAHNKITNKLSLEISRKLMADIENQLALKDNAEYKSYQNKIEWLTKHSSLRGTQVGGAYPVDADGHLLAHISIKHRFDYFLTLLGELSYKQLISLIEEDIEQSLQNPARNEAILLFGRYLDYKYALKALDDEISQNQVALTDREAIIARQISLYQGIDMLRYEYFELDFRQAFFGQEIKDEQALIADLQGTESNSAKEDKSQLTELIKKLEKQSLETGEDVFNLQAQTLGLDAAQRLSNLRDSRQILNDKVKRFMVEREQVLSSGFSDDLQNQEIDRLIVSSFTQSEQKRLPALIKMLQ